MSVKMAHMNVATWNASTLKAHIDVSESLTLFGLLMAQDRTNLTLQLLEKIFKNKLIISNRRGIKAGKYGCFETF